MLEYKNIFSKGYKGNSPEQVFLIKKVKELASWTYLIKDINGEDIGGIFIQKEQQKSKQTVSRIEKVIKKNDDKLYVKRKSYDNSVNSVNCRTDKSDML